MNNGEVTQGMNPLNQLFGYPPDLIVQLCYNADFQALIFFSTFSHTFALFFFFISTLLHQTTDGLKSQCNHFLYFSQVFLHLYLLFLFTIQISLLGYKLLTKVNLVKAFFSVFLIWLYSILNNMKTLQDMGGSDGDKRNNRLKDEG